MNCPKCQSSQLTVIDSRAYMQLVKRRRKCLNCGFRFNTLEIIEKRKSEEMISEKMQTIKIKYLRDIQKIEKIEIGDWVDLRAAEDVTMQAGEYTMIPLGVAMELPKGYEALVAPRSSTFKKYGVILTNSIGVIDETYKGDNDEWKFLAYAMRDTVIHKNERICQFRIIKHQPEVHLIEVDTLGNPDRGGVGSTGTF